MGAVVTAEIIEPGPRADAILDCLQGKFPDRAGLLEADLIEVHALDDTSYDDLWKQVERALHECGADAPEVVRLRKSSET